MSIYILFPSAFIVVVYYIILKKSFHFLLTFIILEKSAVNLIRVFLKVIYIFSGFFEDFPLVFRFKLFCYMSSTVSPLRMIKFCSKSMFVSPLCSQVQQS